MNGRKMDRVYYTWLDQNYREFMTDVLRKLEPCQFSKGTIIYNELDEFMEVFFISPGSVAIGIEINKKREFILRYDNKVIVGAFGVTFGWRSRYIYKCVGGHAFGYFIRK